MKKLRNLKIIFTVRWPKEAVPQYWPAPIWEPASSFLKRSINCRPLVPCISHWVLVTLLACPVLLVGELPLVLCISVFLFSSLQFIHCGFWFIGHILGFGLLTEPSTAASCLVLFCILVAWDNFAFQPLCLQVGHGLVLTNVHERQGCVWLPGQNI